MDNADRDSITALLADERLQRTADYARRGRPLVSMDTDDLKADWVLQFRRFVDDPDDHSVATYMDDVESELALRKVDLPKDEIRHDALVFLQRTIAYTRSLPRAELIRLNDALARDCDRYRATQGSKQ